MMFHPQSCPAFSREDGTSPKHAARLLRGGSAAAVMSPAPDLMLAAAHTSDGLHRVETSPAAVPAGASRTPFNSHDEPHAEPGAVSLQRLPAFLHCCLISHHPADGVQQDLMAGISS